MNSALQEKKGKVLSEPGGSSENLHPQFRSPPELGLGHWSWAELCCRSACLRPCLLLLLNCCLAFLGWYWTWVITSFCLMIAGLSLNRWLSAPCSHSSLARAMGAISPWLGPGAGEDCASGVSTWQGAGKPMGWSPCPQYLWVFRALSSVWNRSQVPGASSCLACAS